jgi:hypothetical protein
MKAPKVKLHGLKKSGLRIKIRRVYDRIRLKSQEIRFKATGLVRGNWE